MLNILIYIIAGLGAGIVTGLAGLSAASVISPLLITVLNFDPFVAIGVSLSSDVLASALSAATYARHKHIDVKGGLWLLIPAMVLTVAGCFVGYSAGSTILGLVSCLFPIVLGIRFILSRDAKPMPFAKLLTTPRLKHAGAIVSGAVVGTICGFSGAGGGMMMLMLLTALLSYELKTAVGTSVFIMMFLALVGAISHFSMVGHIEWTAMIVCALSALVGAFFASRFANRVKPKTLNRCIGVCLVTLGLFLSLFKFVL